jgi:hypothetical protein
MQNLNKLFNFMRVAMWIGAAVLLSIPAICMAWFPETGFNWTGSDFVVMGVMLLIACGTIEFIARLSDNFLYRLGAIVAVGTAFVTVWVNLAVGMILSERNPENLVFLGVIGIAAVGALVTRFGARGMAVSMAAAGIAQALIATTVAVLRLDDLYTSMLIGAFALPWLLAAALFHKAAGGGELAHA